MDEPKMIQVIFKPEEAQLHEIIQKHCSDKGIDISDYIKDVIKKDLAWGHFARRKRAVDRTNSDRSF